MDVILTVRKKRQQVTQSEVRVNVPCSREHPKMFTRALISYLVTGENVEEAGILRLIELSPAKKCPVQFMLAQAFPWGCITMFTKMMATAIDNCVLRPFGRD